MTVYVDLLFGLNTVINYLLLRGSAAIGGHPGAPGRLLAAASLGGIYAVAAVIPGLQWLERLPIQGISAGLMLLAAFGWKKSTIRQGLFFFSLSTAFGGAVLLLVQVVDPGCLLLSGRVYYAVSTPALLLLAGLGYGIAALVLTGCGSHIGGDIVALQLELNGRSIPIRALRDTGNTLRDPLTGQTVLVAGVSVLQKLLPQVSAAEDKLRTPDVLVRAYPACRFRLIPYRAVGTEDGLLLAVRCQVRQGKRELPVLTAFSPTPVSADGSFDALWGGVQL